MFVTKIYNLFRNDCTMDTECEHCGNVSVDKYAYNDSNYIQNVVPDRHCENCGKNAKGETKTLKL